MSVSVNQETITEANEIYQENEAIEEVIASVPEENEHEVAKIFSENPWMSAESFLQSYIKSIENPSDATKISDILGKDYLSNPLESIARFMPDHSAILGKSALNPVEGLATATTRISDFLGKDYLSNPLESLARLMPGHSAILGKSVLNSDGEARTRFSGIGIHYHTTSSERKDDKSANK